MSEQAFTNSPYWSLGYEVWYYVLFGVYFYLSGWNRVIFCGLVFAFIGFKLWLLLPVWWAGVWLYNNIDKITLSKTSSRALFWGSILLYIAYVSSPLHMWLIYLPTELLGYEYDSSPLGTAKKVLSDYLVATLFVINVIGYRYSGYSLNKYSKTIQSAAQYTFILYLAHAPIMRNISAYFEYDTHSIFSLVIIMCIVLLIIRLLAFITEDQKHLYKSFFDFVLTRLWMLKKKFN